ncbi:HlyD family type I secretion periplasmic adaptor subunit [Azohydromonas aeria]|uniref:HlyD family type I secretion periplasmic adaptor subunit n=1 Tax=Azohydromonas aeria TaxID=2590212 RepID=UPI0012F713A8|nr:HlyD family type I secretion periplasmic adaptor subunit [Azohydromonas aeria]
MSAIEMRSLPHDPDQGARRTVAAMVGVMLLFVVVALGWAALAQLDVAVQARGSVVPPSRLQEVASLDGGLVQEMLVQPGQRVRKGELLARLDTAQAQASLGENRQQRLAALAGRARADALLAGTAPRFEEAWRQEAPDLIDKETQLWRDALAEQRAALAAAREGIQRRRGELTEAQARIDALQGTLKVAQEAFQIEERLWREGAGARADFLAAQQRLLAQQAELDGLQQSLPRLRAQVTEAQSQAAEVESRTRAQWGQQRSEFESKAAALGAVQGGHEDRLSRREVHAPMDGVVNRVLVPTLGGVAAPGKPIVEIVPDEAQLLMALRVKPADIGFIREGQEADVRVLAYDTATYGQMKARVVRVGADAVVDDKGEAYFEVQLGAARDQIRLHGKPLPVSPGMPVDAGVLTGQRSVLQYLMKPVLRGIQGALQER